MVSSKAIGFQVPRCSHGFSVGPLGGHGTRHAARAGEKCGIQEKPGQIIS